MSYIIRRLKDIEKKERQCGLAQELTTSADFKNADITFFTIKEETKKHYHKTLTEFYYILDGTLDVEFDDKKEHCEPGTLIMIKPNTKHKAYGNAHIIVICSPAFDPKDEIVVE